MPELMEHGSIDEIAAHAVATVRRDASARPLPELRLRRPRRWVAPAMALATLIVVVVGLIAIGTNRDEHAGSKPPDVHWLLRDVPAGWRPISAYDASTAPVRTIDPELLVPILYVTDDQPLGPTLSVQGTTDTSLGMTLGSYSVNALRYEELEIDGHRAAFADVLGGSRGLYVEIDGAWAYLSANRLGDEVLVELARTLTPDSSGRFDVAASALPDGMREIAFNGERPLDAAAVGYAPARDGSASMTLSVGSVMPDFLGRFSVGFDVEAVTMGDFSGYLAGYAQQEAGRSFWLVVWERDGLDFAVSGNGVTREEVLAAAASASPASADEWAQLVASQPDEPDATAVTEGTTAPDDPEAPPVSAPADSRPHDVDITVQVTDVSANEQRWSGELPSGEIWSAVITRVYDQIAIRHSIDGLVVQSYGTQISASMDDEETCCQPMAITTDPDAEALRVVRSNGDRYTIPLHELPGTDGVRIALVAIPDENAQVELVDTEGNVIESYTSG